jgi:glycosyltransferase involved in cell wall biosynthesis
MLEHWALKRQGLAKHIKKRLYWQLCEKTLVNKAARVWFTTRREEERTRCIFDIVVPSNIVSVYGIEAVEHGDIDNSYDNRKIPDKRIALFLGRLHPKKNVPFLLRCWREAKVSSEWVLVVAGSGDPVYEAQVRNQVRALGLSSQVYFAGFVSGREKTRLLQRAEWFLLPSSQENFGVAVLEAVAHGCAVAIADQVYLSESFRPGSVVLPLEFEAWTEFLRGPLQDLKFARMTAEADKAYLLKSFAMELVVSRWVAAFRQLCES